MAKVAVRRLGCQPMTVKEFQELKKTGKAPAPKPVAPPAEEGKEKGGLISDLAGAVSDAVKNLIPGGKDKEPEGGTA